MYNYMSSTLIQERSVRYRCATFALLATIQTTLILAITVLALVADGAPLAVAATGGCRAAFGATALALAVAAVGAAIVAVAARSSRPRPRPKPPLP